MGEATEPKLDSAIAEDQQWLHDSELSPLTSPSSATRPEAHGQSTAEGVAEREEAASAFKLQLEK